MNNVCFIHICTIGNFQHVVDEIFDYIKKSFLYKELECIYINIAGNENVWENETYHGSACHLVCLLQGATHCHVREHSRPEPVF